MDVLEYDSYGEILRLTLNRPEKLNALNVELLSDLNKTLRNANGEYTVVVIEGAGDAFTAGADLDENVDGTERIELFQNLTRAVRAFNGIVIGKLHGYAIGGGFEFTLSFDLRYAQEGTLLRLTESEIGVTVSNATSLLLPLMVGDGRAREMVFTGQSIEAAEAKDIGLVSGVYSKGQLEEKIREVAHDIVDTKSKAALCYNKNLLNNAVLVEQALNYEELQNTKLREESDEFSQSSPK